MAGRLAHQLALPLARPPQSGDATTVASLFDGDQLRIGRELRGLMQYELAEAIGVTPAAISQFENHKNRPLPATVLALSARLDLPIGFFVVDERFASEHPDAFFRRLRATRTAARNAARAHAELVHRIVIALGDYVRLPDYSIPRFPVDVKTDIEDIETLAAAVRHALAVPPGPLRRLLRLLESYGLVACRLPTEDRAIDAFSVPFSDHPIVVLGTEKGDAARSRFDAAHELGHLVMHDENGESSAVQEHQANWFAASLLMPAEDILPELPPYINFSELVRVKQRWGVSISALIQRSMALGLFDKNQYRQAMKTMSQKGWRSCEPGPIGKAETPTLLVESFGAATEAGVGLADIAALASVPLRDAQEILTVVGDHRPVVRL
jgi:Zn-dependent peptidase ImmA (M78 family)/transcriptional regulator with XRE-family HTH domain